MKTAWRKTTLRHRFHLIEEAGPQRRVDRERGVIYDVQLIGNRSSNNRWYPPETLREAAHLYESAPVNCDHPDDPDAQRSVRDRLGVIRNVRVTDKGLRGDLHLIRSHPMADSVMESALNPNLSKVWGFSHNADGECDVEGGKTIVRKVTLLRSLDLVSDPATTQGLFESRRKQRAFAPTNPVRVRRDKSKSGERESKGNTPMKLLEWFDRTRLLPSTRRVVKKLFEESYMDPDSDAPVMEDDVESAPGAEPSSDPAEMDPESALRMGFRASQIAILDDTTMPVREKIKKLGELLRVAEKLLSAGEEIPEEDESVEDADAEVMEEEDCDEEEKPVVEAEMVTDQNVGDGGTLKAAKKVPESRQALKRRVAYLEREKKASQLCRENGVEPTATLLEALSRLDSDAKRLALIEPLKPARKAKTTAATYVGESRTNGGEMSTEDFVRSITVAG